MSASLRRRACLTVEALEDRLLLTTSGPLGGDFPDKFDALLDKYHVPQASLAVQWQGETYHRWHNGTGFEPAVNEDTVFRVGSVSKVVTAAAIMKLIHDGATVTVRGQTQPFSLDDSAFLDLGYARGQTLPGYTYQSNGTWKQVELPVSPLVFDITVRQLLQMTSGFQNNIPLASAAFPKAGTGDVMYREGNYAALLFNRGGDPGTTPATVQELMNYVVTQDFTSPPAGGTTDPFKVLLYPPGTTYDYNNFGYLVLGALAEKIALEYYKDPDSGSPTFTSYEEFVQAELFQPFGITTMKLGRTLWDEALPNEARYYPPEQNELYAYSVYPDPNNTNPDSLFLGPLTLGPYGGDFYLEGHYGNGAWVASPTDLVKLYNGLNEIYTGARNDGPLSQKNLVEMVAPPVVPGTPGQLPASDTPFQYFGLGWDVEPSIAPGRETWVKDGSLFSNQAYVWRLPDGTVWAFAANTTPGGDFGSDLRNLVSSTLYPSAPTLAPFAAAIPVDSAVAFDALAGAKAGPSGSVMMPNWVYVSKPTYGTAVVDPNTGTITYTPDPGYYGPDSFEYDARNDLYVRSAPRTAVIQVQGPVSNDTTGGAGQPAVAARVHAVGSGAGRAPWVRVLDASTGAPVAQFLAYRRGSRAGVRVAVGDVTGDGVPDIITVPGAGVRQRVKVFDGRTGAVVRSFVAGRRGGRRGLFVAAGDFNRDGHDDVVVGSGASGRVRVFSGRSQAVLADFLAHPGGAGGIRVAVGDFEGDGVPDIHIATRGGARRKVFRGLSGEFLAGASPTDD